MATAVKRHITFDPVLNQRAERRARQYGVNFPEYIRILVVNDTQPMIDHHIETLNDPELEESLEKALEDLKEGRIKEIKNVDDYIKKSM